MKQIFKSFAFVFGMLSTAASAQDLLSPLAGEIEPNRDLPAAQMLRLKDNHFSGRFEMPMGSYKLNPGGTGKVSGQRFLFEGVHAEMAGMRFGLKLDMLTERMKFAGVTSKFEKSEIAIKGSRMFAADLGLGAEIASVTAKSNGVASESYLKFIPSVIWVVQNMEVVGTWHPTIAIAHKGVYEPGYLRGKVSYALAPETMAIGELTHYRYGRLDSGLNDAFGLYGGIRQVLTPDYVGAAFLAIDPGFAESGTGLAAYPQAAGSIGVDVEGEMVIGGGQQLGAKMRWRNGSSSSDGLSVKRNTIDLMASYARKF